MANKKISDFREAMLSNTKFIGKDQDEPIDMKKSENAIQIDKKLMTQFKILARYTQTETKDIIHEALAHYLKLKKVKLEQAMLDMTKEEE